MLRKPPQPSYKKNTGKTMKLLIENWRSFLNEEQTQEYYWKSRGPWVGEELQFGVTHVPKAIPQGARRLEEIFEKVRKEEFPGRPSRLDCVFLCDGLGEGHFCPEPDNKWRREIFGEAHIFRVELRGNPNVFRTDSEYWTEASVRSRRGAADSTIISWAQAYWEGNIDSGHTFIEVLVSPPESAIILEKLT